MTRKSTYVGLVAASIVTVLGVWVLGRRELPANAAAALPTPPSSASASPTAARATSATRLNNPQSVSPAEPASDEVRFDARVGAVDPATTSSAAKSAALRFLQTISPERYSALTAAELETLTTVDLRGTKTTDADLAFLAALPALESVSLRGTQVTDAGMASLCRVTHLTSLDLRSTGITAAGIPSLPTGRLEALHLTSTRVTGTDLRWLPAMPRMRTFKLNELAVDDAALDAMPSMPSLQHLEIDGSQITGAGLRRMLDRNPRMKRVEARRTGVTQEDVATIRTAYPGVEIVLN